MLIDLRSDTVTQPTAAMRERMAAAVTGDDVYGEDATVNALEQRVAQLLGKPAALLCSSGTQSNLLALLSQCQRGEEYLVGEEYHTYRYEAGGAAVLGGIVPQTVPIAADGSLDITLLEQKVKADDPHFPITRLLALENTHTGKVVPHAFILAAQDFCRRHNLRFHLDGARLFNAHVASGMAMHELAAPFDSVSVCFSKGLGTPIGSVLVADEAVIHKARRWRKMLGGGMRQAGIMAAALDYALDHHIQRLAEDHHNATLLAAQLHAYIQQHEVAGVVVEQAHTNMVYVQFANDQIATQVAEQAWRKGIRVPRSQRMRLVTHLDITTDMVAYTSEQLLAPLREL